MNDAETHLITTHDYRGPKTDVTSTNCNWRNKIEPEIYFAIKRNRKKKKRGYYGSLIKTSIARVGRGVAGE